jgi:hypothetical protein
MGAKLIARIATIQIERLANLFDAPLFLSCAH